MSSDPLPAPVLSWSLRLKRGAARIPGVYFAVRCFRVLRDRNRFRAAVDARLQPLLQRVARLIGLERLHHEVATSIDRTTQHAAWFHLARVGRQDAIPGRISIRPSVLIDLRITQIGQRERGIPRYALALALALPEALPEGEVSYLVDPDLPLPDCFDQLRSGGQIIYGPEDITRLTSVTHFLQTCVFELHKDAEVLFPVQLARFKPRLTAIAYDLIPCLYPEQYLTTDYLRRRYQYQMQLFGHLDCLFAISACTAEDFVRLCHLQTERVIPIYGGVDRFRFSSGNDVRAPEELLPPERGQIHIGPEDIGSAAGGVLSESSVGRKNNSISITSADGQVHHLRQPYWLYVGGDDFRKNVAGLIRGFARARKALPDVAPTLVIACKLPVTQIVRNLDLGKSLGLEPGVDLVLTGFISDEALETCYRGAFSVVFPSLYEGLGLPVLEGYHFGVPAIVSRNSSLCELAPSCCQFDVSSEAEMADLMIRMHRDTSLRDTSLAFANDKLSQLFNWQAAAMRVATYLNGGESR